MPDKPIEIVDFETKYASYFRSINEEWISAYFKMEAADYKALDNPQSYILDKGGCIIFALDNDLPVGTCALIKMDDPVYDFELAKMGVVPSHHGKGIGKQIGEAIIKKAEELGAEKLYLESNRILTPAINLYKKLGFVEITGRPSPYKRSNILMGLDLSKS